MTVISPFSGTPESQHAKIENSPSQPILVMQKPSAPVAGTGKSQTKSKPRKRVNTAEKRNQHNAIERQRRETLNGKFLSLARVLPALASHRRPSKSAIVNGSISHLSFQRDQRLLASRLLRQLCADRDALAKEVNEWRAANGFARQESLTAWCDEMEEVCNVEKEVFGNFANMEDGDDEGDMDQDGEYAGPDFVGDRERESDLDLGLGLGFNGLTNVNRGGNMSLEQAAIVAAANVDVNVAFNPMSGMITPRTSTDMDFPSYGLNMPMPHKDLLPMGSGQVPQPRVQLHHHQMQLPQQQQQSGINWADFSFANPVTAASGNANMKPAASDLGSSTGSLPFNAFMAESLASSSSPSGCSPTSGGNGIPTPPTTAEFGSGFTHTPSPRSSHSGSGGNGVDDSKVPVLPAHGPLGRSMSQQPWNEQQQQLMLLHSVQQQQLQQRQQAQASMLQQTPHPAHASLHVNVNGAASMRSQTLPQIQGQGNNGQVPFNPSTAFGSHGGFTGGNGGADVVALMSMLSQHQQQTNVGGNGNGNGYTVPSQPQLHRAQTEQMDAWRRMTIAGGNIGGGVWA